MLCMLVLIIATFGSYLASSYMPRIYQARAQVVVPLADDATTNEANLQTQIALMTSTSVLQAAAHDEGLSLSRVSGSVAASQRSTSQVIDLVVKDGSAKRAVGLTANILKSYQEVAASASELNANVSYLESRIADLSKQLGKLPLDSSDSASSGTANQRALLLSQLASLQDRLTTSQLSGIEASTPIKVVTNPYLEDTLASPKPLLASVGGFLGGTVLDAVIVYLWLRRRRTFATAGGTI